MVHARWPSQTFNYSITQADVNIISDIESLHAETRNNKEFALDKNRIELTQSYVRNNLRAQSIINYLEEQIKSIYNTDVKFFKLWFVRTSFHDSNKEELPYIPHIDKDRYIKSMIYLQDVGIDDGPFHVSNLAAKWIEGLRLSLPSNYKQHKLNCLTNLPAKFIPMPILGQKGKMCIFDTNSPHHAGIVKRGHRRFVVRFDFTLNYE